MMLISDLDATQVVYVGGNSPDAGLYLSLLAVAAVASGYIKLDTYIYIYIHYIYISYNVIYNVIYILAQHMVQALAQPIAACRVTCACLWGEKYI